MTPYPFVSRGKRLGDSRPLKSIVPLAPLAGRVGPADILLVNGDSVRVCRIETANGPLMDGPMPLTLCHDKAAGEPARLVDGVRVTHVGGVVMLRVE
jgi:hypothetical protein